MGLGPGFGARGGRAWVPRLVLLAVLAVLALVVRGHGPHSGLRGGSYLAIIGLLLLRFVARSRRRSVAGRRPPGWGRGGPVGGARFGPGGPFWGTPEPERPVPLARPEGDGERGADAPASPTPRWPPPVPGTAPVDSPVANRPPTQP